jgi:putative transposase
MQVSKSGYYKWAEKQEKINWKEAEIIEKVYEIYHNNKGRYGSRRIRYAMLREGMRVNRKHIQRIMRQMGIRGYGIRKYKVTTKSKHKKAVNMNLINQNFRVKQPNKLWVSDITYLRTKQGWMYLNVIIDCYGRRIVSWSIKPTMDKEIVIDAVQEGIKKEKPKELIFHSDRGVQYASEELRKIFKRNAIKQSMSGKGNCYDNAVAESFFKTLKVEIGKKVFQSREEAELEVFKYIEMYYNNRRLHSSNMYRTPNEVYYDYKNRYI